MLGRFALSFHSGRYDCPSENELFHLFSLPLREFSHEEKKKKKKIRKKTEMEIDEFD